MINASLKEFCDSIFELFNIPLMIYHKNNGQIIKSYMFDDVFYEPIMNNPEIISRYSGHNMFNDDHIVSYYISDDLIAFARIIDKQSEYNLYIGPCLLVDPTEELINTS